ncbi:Protein MRVI1 [Liparis tanakae]|uniref:Protein MRVI1 n=1 Tax=Liparis tanakae TaxID=230148 RepID=A0A4Z2J8A5_9TELE|nr:Protein MRVI1 [Liparis tanakae]
MSPEQDGLAALRQLLDPDCQDPHVSRETFHATMREWIAQCSQDSEGKDLLGTVADLKLAHRKLSEQNSGLLRTVAQGEDVNLQLTLEVTEMRAKLASAQGSAVRARSLTEELEETRRAFKEAQDRASRTQTSCNQLNEKLSFERTCSEDSINKLRKVNAELRAELEETLIVLTLRDREIAKKDILMDKMKNSHVENHSMIEQHHRDLEDKSLPSLHTNSDDIQSIIHRIRLQELELNKCVWEEKGEKVEERWRASEKEQTQIQEAKKVAVVNWWKARSVEGTKTRTKDTQSHQETPATNVELQQAEQTILDMREQVCLLQTSLISAQECVAEKKNSSLQVDKGTNTERKEPDRAVKKEQRDAAVATDVTSGASEQEQTRLRVTTDGLLETLRRMEAMVNSALENAELVRESEQRVSQVKVRMESITQRVEEALGRAADTDEQLDVLEARITEKDRTQLLEEEEHLLLGSPPEQSGPSVEESCSAEPPFIFPHTRSRPPLLHTMPTLPEEEEDSPEDLDSSSSSPSTCTPGLIQAVVMTAPTIVYPQQATIVQQDGRPLEQTRPHNSTGNVIDLLKDPLPEPQLSEEDRQKNLELLQQAKKGNRLLVDWRPSEKRKVSSGTLTPRFAVQKENCDPAVPKSPPAGGKADEGPGPGRNPNQALATGVAKPVPRPPTQQAPCTAEIKTIGAFPPLMRAVSWDVVGTLNSRNGAPTAEDTVSDKPRDAAFKSSGFKDLPAQQGGAPKLSKFREEHKLLRNQSTVGSKLPDLSEAAEQERATSSPQNAFVQLSLAFRNDNYTLEMRLKQAERERNLTEEDTEKELEEFKGALKEKRMNKATEVMMQYVENLKRTYEKDHAELTEFKKLANQNSNRCYGGSREMMMMMVMMMMMMMMMVSVLM